MRSTNDLLVVGKGGVFGIQQFAALGDEILLELTVLALRCGASEQHSLLMSTEVRQANECCVVSLRDSVESWEEIVIVMLTERLELE
jgi:hypothetical protein